MDAWHYAEMFEWHGWAVVVASPGVADDENADTQQQSAEAVVRDFVAVDARVSDEVLDVRSQNGQLHVWISGCHNHPTTRPTEVLTHIGELAPGSYGVLHSIYHGIDRDWTCTVLRRGSVASEVERALSPHIPTLEDPATSSK